MELKFKKEITEKIIIDLPVFTKSPTHNYMVFMDGSREACIQVCKLEGYESIGFHHAGLAFNSPPEVNSNAQEFKEALTNVLDVIAVKSNLLIDVSELPPEPSEEEYIIGIDPIPQ